ncbi:Sap-like sulfolipid-1-addressing protein [Lentzea atacamensis]|uniref:Sap-like sulfolipid-1-addressing protein n=1 Tax=Lentzea atacamensis TaxID=531938 RepID=A0ABX9EHW1_9PSEU|nr:GAP family protein [Lentzea atacamensis]RAS69766.1 Sap-like sulfolipid-1-addressing protein [Lentzea atacamensis]
MTSGLVAALAGLALLDSTSIGTLFIPIWLMLTPGRLRLSRFGVYLGTITVFYFAVGVVIVLGASQVMDHLDSRLALWIQLVIGVLLFVISFRFDGRKKPDTGKWRNRLNANGSAVALAGVAVLAGVVELATMLPYLGAIGMMSAADLGLGQVGLLLAGYCLVMIVPAVLLLGGRLALRDRIEPFLTRISTWFAEKGASTTGWILGIAGFLVARDAIARLFFL